MVIDREKGRKLFWRTGLFLVLLSLFLFGLVFWPILQTELTYLFSSKVADVPIRLSSDVSADDLSGEIVPADRNFDLIIPKIEVNSKVVPDVDPFSPREYRAALKEGIAQARGTGLPGEGKNIFLFAHSSGNFYELSRTNTVFYLLDKLEPGDKIAVVYKDRIFNYAVSQKKTVAATATDRLTDQTDQETLTLMTCWPPGTDYERLLIMADKE